MDIDFTKLADAQFAAFTDELEKIAAAGGLSDFELEMLKEAWGLAQARQGLQSVVGRGAQALEHGAVPGMGAGAGKLVHALNVPIETGAAGKALQSAGHQFSTTAAPGAMGGGRAALGQFLHHKGKEILPGRTGGAGAIAKSTWNVLNPVGNAAELAAGAAGHTISRGAKLDPSGFGHKVLTSYIPHAAEIGGAAGTGMLTGMPMGAAGLLGHHAMGGMAAAAPGMAEMAHHAVGGLGEAAGELAHHVGADVVGTHAPGILKKLHGAMPSFMHAAPVSVV